MGGYLAQGKGQVSTGAPAAAQADLKHGASYPRSVGGDVHHVRNQGEALHTSPRHVCLHTTMQAWGITGVTIIDVVV